MTTSDTIMMCFLLQVLLCLLLAGLASSRPQDSYLAPAASEAVSLYSSPSEAVSLYSSPSEAVETYDEAADLFDLPQDAVAAYGTPPELILPNEAASTTYDVIASPAVEAASASYGLPREDVISSSSQAIGTTYGVPSDEVFSAPSEAVASSYGQPRDEVITAPSEAASTSYGLPRAEVIKKGVKRINKARGKLITLVTEPVAAAAPLESDFFIASSSSNEAPISSYGQPLADNSLEAESQVREVTVSSSSGGRASSSFSSSASSSSNSLRREPEKILRSEFSGPNEGNWNYAYETENGIKQEARGEVKTIGDAQVRTFESFF
jgi:hypothetical protein